ncbi:B-cell receptor CD22-like isoform X2 [Paramacrobiotus metropolitanus]|uniref:B-cell receptor CD22-like isoform X2 n=1 Tax=Paramacrobiotus metropolitanus TaxID=2943436 RepID=UPI002446087F|nr:B-cell receptor CD22-like isoform X2 [Paramacrobiotus metropolitanus]
MAHNRPFAAPVPAVFLRYLVVLSSLVLFCRSQVNIIGIPQAERPFELTIRDGAGAEIDTRRPYVGPPALPEGNTLTLFCETKHPGISHLAWSRDGAEFFGSVSRFSDGLLQNELRITLNPADRFLEYKCRGLNLRFDPVVEKTVHLDIPEPTTVLPISASILPANGTFKANETATLRCIIQGSRGPAIITWWKGDRLMNETSISSATPGITTRNGITSTESSLTFKVTLADHGLAVYCRAISALSQMHDNNTAEAMVKLDILYLPVTQIGKNETILSKENGPIHIPCSLKSNPLVDKVRWYRNDKLVYEDRIKAPNATENSPNAIASGRSDLVQTNALRILQVSRNDIGSYTCEAHNSLGWGPRSNSVEVKVQYKPGPARTAKQQASTEIHAAEGEKLALTCTVADPGNPPSYTFIWRKDGVFLTRGHTYTIGAVQDKHYGSYTCAPYNGAGEGDSASITLTKKEEAAMQTSETTVLMIASILGVVGGTILLAIVIWCLCLSKSCRNRNKNQHLTSKFMTSTYPAHTTLPRPHLISNIPHSATLSREHLPSQRPVSQQKQAAAAVNAGTTFMFGHAASYGNQSTARPNYYPSWYSQRTERSSYVGRYKY